MLSAFSGLFGSKEVSVEDASLSVRSPEKVKDLEEMIAKGPFTLVLVHADWCGHCQTYKPLWSELLNVPGRTANMAMVHHDMVDKIPVLQSAKIPGYPTVIKVYPNGHMEEYMNGQNEKTNAIQNHRDKDTMVKEVTANDSNADAQPDLTGQPKEPNVIGNNTNKAVNSVVNEMKNALKTNTNVKANNTNIKTNNTNVKANNTNVKANTNVSMNSNETVSKPNGIQANIAPRVQAKPKRKTNKAKKNNNLNKVYAASLNTKRNLENNVPVKITNTLVPSTVSNVSLGASAPPPLPPMKGGSLLATLTRALHNAGPSLVLLAAASTIPPKKSRGSTKRLTRKSRRN